ncbi:MAG: bifunctional lysylphosphatidylglycerol flippase/synthetase MprF [Gemmatimonadota bacterium]
MADPASAPPTPPSRLRRLLPWLAAGVAVVSLLALRELLRETSGRATRAAITAIPSSSFATAVIVALLGYCCLGLYDVLALRYADGRKPRLRTALAGSTAFAVSNALGFPLLTGGAVRVRFWTSWGLSAGAIARGVAFNAVTFWLGAITLTALAAIGEPETIAGAFGGAVTVIRVAGVLLVLVPLGYLAAAAQRWTPPAMGDWHFRLPSLRLATGQFVLAILDWTLLAATLWLLLGPDIRPPFAGFIGLFVVAQVAGVVSHLPGGLGVFEAGILLLLGAKGHSAEVLGAVVAFRAVYYVGPFVAALVGLLAWEVTSRRAKVAGWLAPTRRVLRGLAPTMLAAGTIACGLALLASGATPTDPERLRGLRHLLPLGMIEVAHFAGSTIGVALLLLASGLSRRLRSAWWATAVLLALGIAAELLKGFEWEQGLLLATVLVTLLPARRFFYRHSRLEAAALTPGWLLAVAVALLGTILLAEFSYRHVSYRSDLFWRFAIHGDAPRSLRALVGASMLLALVSIRRLFAPVRRGVHAATTAAEIDRAAEIFATSASTHGALALTGDKSLLFDEENRGYLMYATSGRSWIAMGDPIGPPATQRELVWRFRELADQAGAWPVFYEVSAQHLGLYIDLGLTLSKLGEEAVVPLGDFSLDGGARRKLRYTHRSLIERFGCSTELLPPDAVPPLFDELERISLNWMADKQGREKGFSLGRFDRDYLRRLPCAVVRQHGTLVAFATLWPAGDRSELAVDLMRYDTSAPPGTMEYLFIELMLLGRAAGFGRLNLGMAPLAGMPEHALAPLWSRVGHAIFQQGESFYGFQGLRQFKQKFDPIWAPRYLASPGGLALPRVLADAATLIAGGVTRVLPR